jgi:hypothetical protein
MTDVFEIFVKHEFGGTDAAVDPNSIDVEPPHRDTFVDGGWYDEVMSVGREPGKIVVLLGGPGNGKSALASCLLASLKKDSYCTADRTNEGKAAPRHIVCSKGERQVVILNDASIDRGPDPQFGTILDCIKWVEDDKDNRSSLLCINRGVLVEELAAVDGSKRKRLEEILAHTCGGIAEVEDEDESGARIHVISIDSVSLVSKLSKKSQWNSNPWRAAIQRAANSSGDNVFAANAKELDAIFEDFMGHLKMIEDKTGTKFSYRDVWSIVSLFIIGAAPARKSKTPAEYIKSTSGHQTNGGGWSRDLVGYYSLYEGAPKIKLFAKLGLYDPALNIQTSHAGADTKWLSETYHLQGSEAKNEANNKGLCAALTRRREVWREHKSFDDKSHKSHDEDTDNEVRFYGNVITGRTKKTLGVGEGAHWKEVSESYIQNSLGSSPEIAAARLLDRPNSGSVGINEHSGIYVEARRRAILRIVAKEARNKQALIAQPSDEKPGTDRDPGSFPKLQYLPVPEMLVADILLGQSGLFSYEGEAPKDKNRVFLSADSGNAYDTEKPEHLPKAIIGDWSDIAGTYRPRAKTKGRGALPLSTTLSLLQERRAGLPNYGQAIHYLYDQGLVSIKNRDTDLVLCGLVDVVTSVLEKNKKAYHSVQMLDDSFDRDIYRVPSTSEFSHCGKLPKPEDPCEWLVFALHALNDLAGTLPPAVCAEWLTSVLRTGLGFGALSYYRGLGNSQPLLRWRAAGPGVSLVSRSVLGEVNKICKTKIDDPNSTDSTAKNRYELVNYVLQQMSVEDRYYVYSKSNGRGSGVLEPACGWIEMLASLSTKLLVPTPDKGGKIYVHGLLVMIEGLLLKPPVGDVLRLCRKYGLLETDVPADADAAVELTLPYWLGDAE